MTDTDLPFSFPVDVVQLPAGGRVYMVKADEQERAAIAAHLDLQACGRFVATITIMPMAGGVEAKGRFEADITQTCVVSLKALPTTIQGEVLRHFVQAKPPRPEPVKPKRPPKKASRDADAPVVGWVDPEEEVLDPIVEGAIDLGALVVEELALNLDPYPRAPGVAFAGFGDAPDAEKASSATNPFAVLAELKGASPSPRRGKPGRKTRR